MLAHCRTTDDRATLQDDGAQALLGEVTRGDESVVAAPDHDDVVRVAHVLSWGLGFSRCSPTHGLLTHASVSIAPQGLVRKQAE